MSDELKSYLKSLSTDSLKTHQKEYLANEICYSEAVEFQMKDFFIAYAMAFNNKDGRSGSLFVNPFRRVRIVDEQHLYQLVIYIHANVLKHGIYKEFKSYKWSSYQTILSEKKTILQREEILDFLVVKIVSLNNIRFKVSISTPINIKSNSRYRIENF